MPSNLTMRLNLVSQTLIARNRKVRTVKGPWIKFLWASLVLAVVLILSTFIWAYGNIECTTLNYQIAEAKEIQKQHLELNRKLRVELSNLKSIARLEKLAAAYEMQPPSPRQVIKVGW